jgi:mono/diheme cytochrome c family protein
MSARGSVAGRLALATLAAVVGVACARIGTQPEAQVLTAEARNGTVQGDAAYGGAVYATECAACHGANGEGGFGPNLVRSAVAQSYPRTLEQVRVGQGAMPAFATVLSETDMQDVSVYVHEVIAVQEEPRLPDVGTVPDTVSSVKAIGIPSGVNPSNGEETYRQNCSACHGDAGQGTPVGPALTRPIAFDDLMSLILAGRPGMPAFKLLLPGGRLDELAAYVAKTFMVPAVQDVSPSPSPSATGPTGAPHVSGTTGTTGDTGAAGDVGAGTG